MNIPILRGTDPLIVHPSPCEEVGMFTGMVPLSFLGTEIFDDDDSTGYTPSNEIWIDTAHYPGTYLTKFTATLNSRFSANAKTLLLKDDQGTTKASLTVIANQFSTLVETEFTLTPGNHAYYFFVQADAADSFTLVFRDVQIKIYQQNATRTRIQLPFLSSNQQSAGGGAGSPSLNDYFAYCQTYGADVYGFGPFTTPGADGGQDFLHTIFKYEASKWATITSLEYEAIGYFRHGFVVGDTCGCGASGLSAWFNKTDNLQVTDTEVSYSSDLAADCLPKRKVGVFSLSNLVDTKEYQPRMKLFRNANPDPCELRVSRCAVYVNLNTSASGKAQIFHRALTGAPDSGLIPAEVRYKHEGNVYPVGTKFYFEGTGKRAAGGNARLFDVGTTDVGTSGADVAGSTITFNATNSRQRSGELTLTNGNRYLGKISNGTLFDYSNMFVIVETP